MGIVFPPPLNGARGIANDQYRIQEDPNPGLVDPAILGRLLLSGLNQIPRWHKPSGKLSAAEVMEKYLAIVLNGVLVP